MNKIFLHKVSHKFCKNGKEYRAYFNNEYDAIFFYTKLIEDVAKHKIKKFYIKHEIIYEK
jgi:hypothetical protein